MWPILGIIPKFLKSSTGQPFDNEFYTGKAILHSFFAHEVSVVYIDMQDVICHAEIGYEFPISFGMLFKKRKVSINRFWDFFFFQYPLEGV